MAQCGIIYEVPFRFYFNNTATGDFVNEGKGNQDYNVKWHKNDGIFFKLFLDDGTIPVEIYSGKDNFFNLSSSEIAKAWALNAMYSSSAKEWYGDSSYPLSRYCDVKVILKSYRNTCIGQSEHFLRVEMILPRNVEKIELVPIKGEDFSYASNEFSLRWPVTSHCNKYVVRCKVFSQINKTESNTNVFEKEVSIDSCREIDSGFCKFKVSIPSLLAGQMVHFNVRGRCTLFKSAGIAGGGATINGYSRDSEQCKHISITKQGGMLSYDPYGYKCMNFHVCVVDKEGKIVKALAAYVYDGKEWHLTKMYE